MFTQAFHAVPHLRLVPRRRIAPAILSGAWFLSVSTAGAAVVITPTQQTRTISASTSSVSVNEPDFGCSTSASDSDQDSQAAPDFTLFEDGVTAAAATSCTSAAAGAEQESNVLVSSLVAGGKVTTSAIGFGLSSSSFGKSDSIFDVAFTTSNGGPFELDGFLSAFCCCLSSSSVTVKLQTGGGAVIFTAGAFSSPEGGENKVVAWSGNLAAGSYRLIVTAGAKSNNSDGGGGAYSTFDVRLVACDPWCAPPNNDCATAIAVAEGVHPFSNVNATDSGAYPACTEFEDSEIRSDVWYRVTADCTGTMTVATCGATDLDTKIGVYQGDVCPANPVNLVLLGCSDDACWLQSSVTVPVIVGEQFLVRIGGYRGVQGSGAFEVSFACSVPNDICSGAEPIGLGSTAFSTLAGTSGMPTVPACGIGQPTIGVDIWFEFFSPCTGAIDVSTCNSVNYDSKIAVYASCPSEGDLPLACNDDALGCGLSSKLTFQAVGGSTYRVRVGGFQPNVGLPFAGSGSITLTCIGRLGDLNGDGDVGGADLGMLLAAWGNSSSGDLDGDGATDGADLGLLLAEWTG